MKEAVLSMRDIVKCYDDFTAVNGVSLDVYKGETVAIIGPS